MPYRPSGRTEIARQRDAIALLIARAEQIDAAEEIHADLTRYLAVRIAGYLEQAVLALGRSAVSTSSGGIAEVWGHSYLNRSRNPRADELVRFIGRFSSNWASEFEDVLALEEKRGRINSLVGIRNDVAHGKNQGLSLNQAKEYFELVDGIVYWLADRLEPKPGMAPMTPP